MFPYKKDVAKFPYKNVTAEFPYKNDIAEFPYKNDIAKFPYRNDIAKFGKYRVAFILLYTQDQVDNSCRPTDSTSSGY